MSNGGHSTDPSDPTFQAVVKLHDIDKLILQKMEECNQIIEECESFMETVDDAWIRSVVRWHFIVGLTWEQTASKMFYHRNALTNRFYKWRDEHGY